MHFVFTFSAPPAIGETEVIIELLDVNDSPPILETKEAFIKENSPPGSFIAQLKASDQDLDPNAGPFQFFLNSNDGGKLFQYYRLPVIFLFTSGS